jgi:hypothetical protein
LGSTDVENADEKNLDEVDDRGSGGEGLSMGITSYSFFSDTRFLSYTGHTILFTNPSTN